MKIFQKLSNYDFQERLAVSATIVLFTLLPLWIWWYQSKNLLESKTPNLKIFNITGVGSQGCWTLENVNAYNYWWKTFSHAKIHLSEGDSVQFRFRSADVTHIFYSPTLGIEPIIIEPGYLKIVSVKVKSPGSHYYYCMSICGECHYFMRGKIIVGEDPDSTAIDESLLACMSYLEEPRNVEIHIRGNYLFNRMGCISCHGRDGKGNINNPNYVKGKVPALNRLAQIMALSDEEDAEKFSIYISEGISAENMESMDLGISRQNLVISKYITIRDVIKKGRPAARADTLSFSPPLFMPSWENKLSERDIDAILVYLLKHQVWEEEE